MRSRPELEMKKPIVGVVGCGVIGRSWAIVFARAGAEVRLFDAQPGVAARSIDAIRRMLLALDAEAESICERL